MAVGKTAERTDCYLPTTGAVPLRAACWALKTGSGRLRRGDRTGWLKKSRRMKLKGWKGGT